MRIHWASGLISLLIIASGWLASQTLVRVDQDLRVIYAEYTLAATDLGTSTENSPGIEPQCSVLLRQIRSKTFNGSWPRSHRNRRVLIRRSNVLLRQRTMRLTENGWMQENWPN